MDDQVIAIIIIIYKFTIKFAIIVSSCQASGSVGDSNQAHGSSRGVQLEEGVAVGDDLVGL